MRYNTKFLFILFFFSILGCKTAYDEASYIFRNFDLGLGETITADISFCIADLKFDGENLKICEFGEGCHSKFRGFSKLYGNGSAWALFWNHLSQFNLPIWYVGVGGEKFKEEISYETFVKCGGEFCASLEQLQKNNRFRDIAGKGKIEDPYLISNYKAIICVKVFNNAVKEFKEKFKNVLIWDVATSPFVNSKHRTTLLFGEDDLLKYRPKFWLIRRGSNFPNYSSYVKGAAKKIIQECNSRYYVIKPVTGTMGQGIAIVPEKDLEKTLKVVLTGIGDKRNLEKPDDKNLGFWRSSKSKYCLIEEFCESKTITINNIPYDPTMRVLFVLSYNDRTPKIDILGAYWKTPPLALNEDGDFIDKHKSHAAKQKYTALPVESEDLRKITEIMQQFMPRIYEKMIHHERNLLGWDD